MHRGISVVIPVYNGARYLSECIESVCSQTLPATEIIVVDDGSEDETPKVAAGWSDRVRYQRISHGGPARARNHGVRLVATDVLAFIDSDDIWLPSKLELQMAALSREDDPAMVFGHVQQFVSSDLTPEEAAGFKFDPASLPGPLPSTLVIRKSDFDRVGPFDESLATGEFIEWSSRAQRPRHQDIARARRGLPPTASPQQYGTGRRCCSWRRLPPHAEAGAGSKAAISPLWVRSGKARTEQIESAYPSTADLDQRVYEYTP